MLTISSFATAKKFESDEYLPQLSVCLAIRGYLYNGDFFLFSFSINSFSSSYISPSFFSYFFNYFSHCYTVCFFKLLDRSICVSYCKSRRKLIKYLFNYCRFLLILFVIFFFSTCVSLNLRLGLKPTINQNSSRLSQWLLCALRISFLYFSP